MLTYVLQSILLRDVATGRWNLPATLESSEENLADFEQQPVITHTYDATCRIKGCKSKLDKLYTPNTITN